MEPKIKRSILCLYAVSAIQALGLLYSLYWQMQIYGMSSDLAQAGIAPVSVFGVAHVWSVMILVVNYFVIQALKQKNEWGWLSALVVFLLSAPSFAIVPSVIGLISLLHPEVRGQFLSKIQEQI